MARRGIADMLLDVRVAPPFYKNGFVLACDDTRQAALIDPGDEVLDLEDIVRANGLTVTHILLTHGHIDHISGLAQARRSYPAAPIHLHRDDQFFVDHLVETGHRYGLAVEPAPPIDVYYTEGMSIRVGTSIVVRPHHTPGHCPGGVCLQVGSPSDPSGGRLLIVGDTLFAGSIGRTDLPGGDHATLIRSITTTLFAFGDDAVVWPGHGAQTTIGAERRTNPFLT
ncbi:MAG: MBL fold metallo-hydrolase [Acidobacteria bacterium]|nr:MBL fold metallo-hydrolase [Acidobacteriota bacterium]